MPKARAWEGFKADLRSECALCVVEVLVDSSFRNIVEVLGNLISKIFWQSEL
jgi:hypothetical protein